MKNDKEIIVATYSEANDGKAFSRIEKSSMPAFRESDYFLHINRV